jgi:hypothetical protein
MKVENAAEKTFVRKIHKYNVDEIDQREVRKRGRNIKNREK